MFQNKHCGTVYSVNVSNNKKDKQKERISSEHLELLQTLTTYKSYQAVRQTQPPPEARQLQMASFQFIYFHLTMSKPNSVYFDP